MSNPNPSRSLPPDISGEATDEIEAILDIVRELGLVLNSNLISFLIPCAVQRRLEVIASTALDDIHTFD